MCVCVCVFFNKLGGSLRAKRRWQDPCKGKSWQVRHLVAHNVYVTLWSFIINVASSLFISLFITMLHSCFVFPSGEKRRVSFSLASVCPELTQWTLLETYKSESPSSELRWMEHLWLTSDLCRFQLIITLLLVLLRSCTWFASGFIAQEWVKHIKLTSPDEKRICYVPVSAVHY